MVIQKLIVHIRQDAFDVLNITPPQRAKSLAIFPPNVVFAKANTLVSTKTKVICLGMQLSIFKY